MATLSAGPDVAQSGPHVRPETGMKAAQMGRLRSSAYLFYIKELLFAVLFGVSHHSVFSVLSGMNHVAPRGVSMVCCLFVMSDGVMFGGFLMMVSGMRQMF
jgi:hypothetical protein